MINKYKVSIDILVNAGDEEEARLEAGYQIYLKTYEPDTKIAIEVIEDEKEAIEDNFNEDYFDYEKVKFKGDK